LSQEFFSLVTRIFFLTQEKNSCDKKKKLAAREEIVLSLNPEKNS